METIMLDILDSTDIENALTQLAAHKNSAKLVLADYRNEKRLLDTGFIRDDEFRRYEQMITKRINQLPDEPDDLKENEMEQKASAFLSYNHQDMQSALMIKEELALYQIKVKMDLFDVEAGQGIKEFVIQQTRGNNAVIMLISKNSLTSVWVSYESTMAMFDQLLNNQKIITISLDDEFRNSDFSLVAYREFDNRILALKDMIRVHDENNWDTRHLQSQMQRLIDARNQLAPILQKLTEKSVYPVTGEHFKKNLKKIAEQIILTK